MTDTEIIKKRIREDTIKEFADKLTARIHLTMCEEIDYPYYFLDVFDIISRVQSEISGEVV